jgi:SsrA-binding protein
MARPKKKQKADPDRRVICRNKRALRDYFIEDRVEAGLVLQGSEVKSLREGLANLTDAHAEIRNREIHLLNAHISPYPNASFYNHTAKRPRKLLMHRREIDRLDIKLNERGFTLVPLELYFRKGRVKVELGLAKGKHQHDKRNAVKQRDLDREMEAEANRR